MNATQEVHATQEKAESKNGRQPNGRFAPGNPGGPGNPHYRKVAEYKKAMLAFVTIEDLGRIITTMKKKAEEGDVAAARLILQYTLGKPTSADPDMVEVDEWHKLQQQALRPRDWAAVLGSMPARIASMLTHVIWPCFVESNFTGPFLKGLNKLDERDAKRAAAAEKKAKAATALTPDGDNGAAAPKGTGDNRAPRSRGIAPEPNLDFAEDGEWLRRIAQEMFPGAQAAPKANGENGHDPEHAPVPNDPMAGYPDWWEQAVQEEMERIRREEGWPVPSPDGDNGGPAPRAA